MKYTYLKLAQRELDIWHWPEQLVAYVCVVVAFTVMGPFETYSLPLLMRFMYWFLDISFGWIAMFTALTVVLRNPRLDDWPGGARVALAVVLAALPITFATWNIEFYIRPERMSSPFWHLLLNVFFICALVASIVYWRVRTRLGRMSVANTSMPASFLNRLPVDLGKNLISLSMQDHYVEATTDKGTALVLLRFGDAMDELGDLPGAQIHRSHWIAHSAFCGLERADGKLVARLSDNRRLPVSRTYTQTARALDVAISAPQ